MKNTLINIFLLFLIMMLSHTSFGQYTINIDGVNFGARNSVRAQKINLSFERTSGNGSRQRSSTIVSTIKLELLNPGNTHELAEAALTGGIISELEINMNRKQIIRMENVRISNFEELANKRKGIKTILELNPGSISFKTGGGRNTQSFGWDFAADREN